MIGRAACALAALVFVGSTIAADPPLNSENDPLRGQKNMLWEGGVRVCAFANWPGTLAPDVYPAVVPADLRDAPP